MQATRVPTQRQRASRGIAALKIIATTFVMLAMVGRRARQLKVPPRDAYHVAVRCPDRSIFGQDERYAAAKFDGPMWCPSCPH